MKRIAIWALALTLTLGLFAPGVAQAHVKTWTTRLTLQVSDTRIDRGDRVTFQGKLTSRKRQCFRNKTVVIRRNGKRFASTTTNGRGRYSLTRRVRRPGRYRAVFTGYAFGTHPHSHTCAQSKSARVRIRVQ